MIFNQQDYRSFLRAALTGDATDTRSTSLRAFADKLKISTSFLSEILNAKKDLSVELAFKIAVRLNLTETETQYFCLLVQLENEKDPEFKAELSKRLNSLNAKRPAYDLSAEVFKTIAEWHHAAIMELTYLKGTPFTADGIAKKLGITKIEAASALDRLLRLELLEKKGASFQKTEDYVLTESQIPDAAFKSFHRQILEKAVLSLEEQTPKERMSATDIVAIDSKNIKEVDRLSREFSSAVLKLADKAKHRDKVYALSVHFFNLSVGK